MPLISSINGSSRRVYLDAAAAIGGVITFHPVVDVYSEYKTLRQNDESVRPYDSFMEAVGNLPKGGGKFTPRYLSLLNGTKLVIPAGVSRVNITGELLTDDESSPLDLSLVTGACVVSYAPSEAEIIRVSTGAELTQQQMQEAVWNASLASHNSTNSFGWFIQKLLTVVKFLGLK